MHTNIKHINLMQPFTAFGLRNKTVMAPMTRCKCDENGLPSKELGEYYINRARGGLGLIIVESCAVNRKDAKGYEFGCQMTNLSHVEAWKPIVDAIHENGAKVWIQLFHAGRLSVPSITGGQTYAPSAIKPSGSPSFWRPKVDEELVHFQTQTPFVQPEAMSRTQISDVQSDFEKACSLAMLAGFDGVEIHGAHGYLLHEFCSQHCNKREDEYGISEGFLFINELVKKCREVIPKNKVMSYRLSTHMIDNNYLGPKDINFELLVKTLEACGVDVFHSSELKLGAKLFRSSDSLGEVIRKYTPRPIIGCGQVLSISEAEEILLSSPYDLIAFGRVLMKSAKIPYNKSEEQFDYTKVFWRL